MILNVEFHARDSVIPAEFSENTSEFDADFGEVSTIPSGSVGIIDVRIEEVE